MAASSLLALAALAGPVSPPTQAPQKLREVPFPQVTIADSFWAPRRETNRKVSIPHSFEMLESSGNVFDFELAAKGARQGYRGPVYMDSDLYKALEAASYSLATQPDPALSQRVDEIIAKIAAAQRPDGYLNSWYQVNAPDKRFTNLRDHHELYCAGHLFEAAAAHFQATGKKTLLDVATRYADLLCATFGEGPGKRPGYCGHSEVELALVKLWRVTGKRGYFDLARFFLDSRGSQFFAKEHGTPLDRYDGTYWQDNVPIREHRAVVGHAVRAAYLMSGVVDVAAETGDAGLLAMVNRVWRNTTEKNLYVTGGIGPSAHNEGFTFDYDLPNLTAYQETCASVALAMWNHRLNLLTGDAKYADLVEQSLYNGILAGVSLDGKKFFYVNPLESRGNHHRSDWFGCACCPPNETRTLAALGSYAYAASSDGLWVNLYIQGGVKTKLGGKEVELRVKTEYPWDGKVAIDVKAEGGARFPLRLRIPAWCRGAALAVRGAPTQGVPVERGYLSVPGGVGDGDRVELDLPMPPRRIEADPHVVDNRGKLAIARGPLVYCFEECDQTGRLEAAALPLEAAIEAKRRPDLLGGITVLECQGTAVAESSPSAVSASLYRAPSAPAPRVLTAIPYYAWDNRAPGTMRVWMPRVPTPPLPGGPERSAAVSVSFHNDNADPEAVRDGAEPRSSGDNASAVCHFWPHKGSAEWIEYRWEKPVECAGVDVYWFDDTGRGECRIPVSWRITRLDGESWKPVAASGGYEIGKDRWCEARFETITTKAIRLEVQSQTGWASGALEWRVIPPLEER